MSRISYRNYPVLKDVFNKKTENFIPNQIDVESFSDLKDSFHSLNSFFLNNVDGKVNIISETFVNKVNKCLDKLKDITLSEKVIEGSIFLMGDVFILYFIDSDPLNKKLTSTLSVISKTGKILVYGNISDNKIKSFVSKLYPFSFNQIWCIFTNILMFKKYASVEIIESKAKSKHTFAGCKYLNETDLDIEYLDSKWFTTLTNSNGFKVRGFFRLQPKKKDGAWTKELIWIDEFEKKGYNRQAKILND